MPETSQRDRVSEFCELINKLSYPMLIRMRNDKYRDRDRVESAGISAMKLGDPNLLENMAALDLEIEFLETAIKERRGIEVLNKADAWQAHAFTLKDAYQPRPPAEYIAHGLLERSSLSMWYGAPGTLKSMLLADLAVCTAAGCDFLPPLPGMPGDAIKISQAPVLWVDFDNGKRRTDERFEAVGKARDLPETIPLTYYCMPTPWLNAGSGEAMHDLERRIADRAACLLIIDNFGMIRGEYDENAPEIGRVMGNLRALCENTRAAVVLVHHQRKSTGNNTRAGDSLRGHSSIEASLDLALLVERADHSQSITLSATKCRGDDVLPFAAEFSFLHKPGSKELAQAKFYGVTIEDTTSDRAIAQAVLDVVREQQPINMSRLTKAVQVTLVGMGRDRIHRVVRRLVADGKLVSIPGPHASKEMGLPVH